MAPSDKIAAPFQREVSRSWSNRKPASSGPITSPRLETALFNLITVTGRPPAKREMYAFPAGPIKARVRVKNPGARRRAERGIDSKAGWPTMGQQCPLRQWRLQLESHYPIVAVHDDYLSGLNTSGGNAGAHHSRNAILAGDNAAM